MFVVALLLAAPPAGLVTEAAAVKPLARTDPGRAFVAAADRLPPYVPRSVVRKGREWKAVAPAPVGWEEHPIDEATYHGLFYGSPLAYLLAVDRLAEAGGDLRGKAVLDFGHGGVGQLQLFAAMGCRVVGVDVDPTQLAVYRDPSDQGPLLGGSVKLVHGRWPADTKTVAAVGGGFDVIVSKNTLKIGYIHPAEPVDKRLLVDLGVTDAAFLAACKEALKPGGYLVIYNLSPPQGTPYRPMADGRCPFAAADLAAAGFETLLRDEVDDDRARAVGAKLGWGEQGAELVAKVSIFRRR